MQDVRRLAPVQSAGFAKGFAQILSGTRPDRESAGLEFFEPVPGHQGNYRAITLFESFRDGEAEPTLIAKDQPWAFVVIGYAGFGLGHAPARPVEVERIIRRGFEIPLFEPIAAPLERVGGEPHPAARLIAVERLPIDGSAGAPDAAQGD
jgi:hypothetical protein